MVTIVTRAGKGERLTHNEVDANFTNLKEAIEAITPEAFDAVGDGVADDTIPVNAALAEWRDTFDTDWNTYSATLDGKGKKYRVTGPLNASGQSNSAGYKRIQNLTIHADMSGGIVLDMINTRGASLDGVTISSEGTANVPAAGIVYQRPADGSNVDGQLLRNVSIKGEYSKTCLHNYASEVMTLDGIVLQNDSRNLDAYCLSIVRTDSHFAIPSTFDTAKTGAASSNRRFITNMQCFRNPRTFWTITAITKDNPAVCTYTVSAQGIAPVNGDVITIESAEGMTEINQGTFTVANVNTGAGTFELSGINSTAYGTYTSGASVFYQSGPAAFLDPDDRFQSEHIYLVAYGNDAMHVKPTLDCAYFKVHGHVEGASHTSWIHFEPGTSEITFWDFDFYDHRFHTPVNVFRCTASGSGKMIIHNAKIRCPVWTSTVVPTGKMFANPDKFFLYNADITVETRAYMNDPTEFGHFSGRITFLDTGETINVPGYSRIRTTRTTYYDEFDQWSLSPYWNTRLGSDPQCSIALTSTSNRGGRLTIVTGDDAAASLAVNGAMLHGRAQYLTSAAGIDVEFGYGINNLNNISVFLGLIDTDAALEMPAVLAAGDVITPTADDFVGFLYDTDADAGQEFWHAVSRKNAGASQKSNLNVLPQIFSATDYERLRVVVDTDGDAVFYIDSVQVASFTNAIATGTTMAPVAIIFSRAAASKTLSLDYFQIWSGK